MNVELRRDVTAGKTIDDHFSQRRAGLAGEGRDRIF
jgi:hypothetical protein